MPLCHSALRLISTSRLVTRRIIGSPELQRTCLKSSLASTVLDPAREIHLAQYTTGYTSKNAQEGAHGRQPSAGENMSEQNVPGADYTTYSTADLIERISALEQQLREQTARVVALGGQPANTNEPQPQPQPQLQSGLAIRTSSSDQTHNNHTQPQPQPHSSSRPRSESPSSRRARPFDPTLYSTRHIALKFAYLGGGYNGYEHANGNVLAMPTIEEVLWKALRKTRLISPPVPEDADDSMDVVWGKERRLAKYTDGKSGGRDEARGKVRLDLNWDGCQYSKCGRTDKGVSAFGQVIGIRVRSNRPIERGQAGSTVSTAGADETRVDDGKSKVCDRDQNDAIAMPLVDVGVDDDLDAKSHALKPFDPVKDELSYVTMLNAILPPDIRILAWCPDPPPNFDARFSCRERRYKYFFTNPAFCPTPGPKGMWSADGKPSKRREGWLDIEKMREAAKKLEGLHDFRNLCKIDPSKQMPGCERRITYADIVEWEETGRIFSMIPGLNEAGTAPGSNHTDLENAMAAGSSLFNGHESPAPSSTGPKVYAFCVNGSAFLWHQVRCMVAVLFLVGQGLEEPSVIDELLDVDKTPGRPMYEMADDAPLVLWDCIFPDQDDVNDHAEAKVDSGNHVLADSLNWIYAGDEASLPAINSKNDGKFGVNGVVEELWSQWREAKIEEVLAGSLLDLAMVQGDGTSLRRLTQKDVEYASRRKQKLFDGGNAARLAGRYVPVMKKPKMDSLHMQNARWLKGRQLRREAPAKDMAGGS